MRLKQIENYVNQFQEEFCWDKKINKGSHSLCEACDASKGIKIRSCF